MHYFKLQIGSLFVVLFITFDYIRQISGKKRSLSCNKSFDALLIVSPWFIFFDGLTAWTVNHLDTVPLWLNNTFHCLFFLAVDVTMFLSFIYLCDATFGFPKSTIKKILLCSPFVINVLAIFIFIKDLNYVIGKTTNYSMGLSVIACYLNALVYLLFLFFVVTLYRKKIEKNRYAGVIMSIAVSLTVMILQSIFPEILITSIVPAAFILGFYLLMEDPSYRRLEKHNYEMISGFSTLVENKDDSTGGHILRTKQYVEIILNQLQNEKKYRNIISRDFVKNMLNAAPMHDIGKISTPDVILQKPGKLTPEEYEIMKQHAPRGGEIIMETFSRLDNPEFLKTAYYVARYHHEKWNGNGYPEGLDGEKIPLCARIMAIADVFDAVSAKRCYRDAMPIDQCFQIIEKGRGTDFDPDLVDVFLAAKEEIIKVYNTKIFD
ncbi:MAG: HD domain-containing protein [Treponema sp.]|nr:HD domain-containing protein [Treponema sp.]